MIIIFLLMYTASYMPFKTCFIDKSSSLSDILDNLIDALFWTDILINFFSSYEEEDGTLKFKIPEIAKNYIRSWFIMDLLAW